MEPNTPAIVLNDGIEFPSIGFGTYALNGSEGSQSIAQAIGLGYRLIDTAYNYENEGAVGRGIRASGVPRRELFITSKLPGRYHSYDLAVRAIQESLYRLGLDYLDLYLIHWPNPSRGLYVEAWQALIDARRWGLIRSIGLSNFLPEHIETLKKETSVLPSVNQLEMHPYFNQAQQREWQKKYGIVTESWSPLARKSDLHNDPVITSIAKTYGKSTAQIVLRWHTQLGAVPIPKSSNLSRQRQNLSIFDFTLSDEDMAKIAELSHGDGRLAGQDPNEYVEL